ncbi:MAG: hypothetical protein J07HQX50_00630 [Haloquadratum sp. J07HQX50]|nr:MAG: hypothetical protein J07HQX50_00630 [Haloquadratum sp. J07HQX50]
MSDLIYIRAYVVGFLLEPLSPPPTAEAVGFPDGDHKLARFLGDSHIQPSVDLFPVVGFTAQAVGFRLALTGNCRTYPKERPRCR